MIGAIALIAALIITALIQVTVFPAVLPISFRPDAILALAITWGAITSFRQAVPIGVLGGFLIDMWSDGPIGLSGLLIGSVSFLTIIGETPIVPNTVLFPLLLTFGADVILQFLHFIVFQALGRDVSWESPAPALGLLTAVSTSLLVLLMYSPSRWMARRLAPPRVDW